MTSRRNGFWAITAIVFMSVLTIAGQGKAQAQRTMNRQGYLTISGYSALSGGCNCGGEIQWGKYMLSSLWRIEASAGELSKGLKTSHILKTCNVTLGGSYMHRLVSSRSRSVSLYAGGGVFIGYEFYDPSGTLPEYINTGLPSGSFLYGIHGGIEGEFFFTRQTALVIYSNIPVNFSSPIQKVRYKLGAGVRINL